MWKYFTENKTKVWVVVLPALVKSYNNSTHRTIGMKPADVNEKNKDEVWTRVYGYPLDSFPKPKFKVAEHVRVEINIRPLKKDTNPISTTNCTSSRRYSGEIPTCTALGIRKMGKTF
jgi:hypothetical protein